MKEVADKRKIQVQTVAAYLADAIVSGHGYFWPSYNISGTEAELMHAHVDDIYRNKGASCIKDCEITRNLQYTANCMPDLLLQTDILQTAH